MGEDFKYLLRVAGWRYVYLLVSNVEILWFNIYYIASIIFLVHEINSTFTPSEGFFKMDLEEAEKTMALYKHYADLGPKVGGGGLKTSIPS